MSAGNVRPMVTKILSDPSVISEFHNKPAQLEKTFGLTKADVEVLKAHGMFSKIINQSKKVPGAVSALANSPEVLLTGPVENPRVRTVPIPISRRSTPTPRKYPPPAPPILEPPVHPAPVPDRRPRTHSVAVPGRRSHRISPRHRPHPAPAMPHLEPWRRQLPPVGRPGWFRRHMQHSHCDCCGAILEIAAAAARAVETVTSRYSRKVGCRRVF
jgi:hypothetical protein